MLFALILGAVYSVKCSVVQIEGFTSSACMEADDTAFFMPSVNEGVTFEVAEAECKTVGLELARIDSIEVMNVALGLLNGRVVWLGIRDFNQTATPKPSNTDRFSFTDGIDDNVDFIQGPAGQFP